MNDELLRRHVPFNDLSRRSAEEVERLTSVARRVIASGQYLLGPETEAFEAEFASSCSVTGCVAVGNGTDALEIALRALGCERGDEVIVTSNAGMYATVACLAIGATPVFADVDEESLLISAESAAALVTDATRAVVATHLYGNVVDIPALRAALPVSVSIVEDCAQAHGAAHRGRPVGSLGDVGAFSFYPTKNLGAMGDAGAVVSNRAEVTSKAHALRQYGWEARSIATTAGGRNSRMDEIQAAILRDRLPAVGERNERRALIRARYVDALSSALRFVGSADAGAQPVTHLCVVRSEERERLLRETALAGVSCAVHYPVPDHRQVAMHGVESRHGDLTETERACNEVVSLPCFPELTDGEVERVIQVLQECI